MRFVRILSSLLGKFTMRKKILPVFLAVSFWLSSPLYALSSPLYAEVSKIEALKQENSGYHKTIKKNAKTVDSYKGKTERAAEILLQAKRSLTKAEEAFVLTQEKYDKHSSPENLRLLEMSGERKALAIKKVAVKEKRLSDIEEEVSQLAVSDSSLNSLIKRNVLEIKKLEDELRKNKLQVTVDAQRDSQSELKVTPLPLATVVPIPSLAPVPVQTSLPVELGEGRTNLVVVAGSTASPSGVIEVKEEGHSDVVNPMLAAVVEIKQYLAGNVSQSAKTLRSVATTHRGKKINFSHLGGEIYSGEVKLMKGQHTISFDNSRFKINIAVDDHRKTHVLYFDNRTEKRRLIVIEKSAEAGL